MSKRGISRFGPRGVAAALASAVLVVGCGQAKPVPSTGSTELATGTPAAVSTDFTSSELCPGGTGHTCRLGAGEHHSLGFGDGIEFTLAGDWIVRANETDLISLESGLATNPDVLELITGAPRFADAASGAYVPVTDAARAKQLMAAIADSRYAHVTIVDHPSPSGGGAPTQIFDVAADEGNIVLFDYPVTNHHSWLESGRVARFVWSTLDGAPLIISIECDARHLDAFLAATAPIIASLEFGDED